MRFRMRKYHGRHATNSPRLHDFAAYALALPSAADFFKSTQDYQPKFFDAEDFAAPASTEILIPTDETPGAREARCAQFIDFVLRRRRTRLETNGVRQCAPCARRDSIQPAPLSAKPSWKLSPGGTAAHYPHPAYFAYRLIKQQNTFAFYTSRTGMIEVLDYRGNSHNPSFPCVRPS